MLFKREKHGAPVRQAFQAGKAWRTSAPRFLTHDAKGPWQNWILPRPMFPCPICVLRRPRITKSSGSCSRARQRTCQNAPRGFLPSHGLPPTMAAFRRKAAQLQIQLRGKPRIPTGFLLIPPPRSAATKGMMIRRISFTMSKIPQHRTIVNCFLCILAAS